MEMLFFAQQSMAVDLQCFHDLSLEDVPIYAVYPSGKHLSPKVRAFLDFLIETYGPVPYWDEAGDHNSDAAKRTVI